MNIGEKIKKLRTAKLMTQAELAGTEITRNMLSRIENGSANPSLETICYLAGRLHVSPGFLLAEAEDEQIYVKQGEIQSIKQAWMTEDYQIVRDMCLHSESGADDEIRMILAYANAGLAKEAFDDGNLHLAAALWDEAVEACSTTVYPTESVVAQAGVYFRYMHRISATLGSNVMDEEEVNIFPAMTDEFCRYAAMMVESEEESSESWAQALIRFAGEDSPLTLHLEAKKYMGEGNFEGAYTDLHRILTEEASVPKPVLYFVFCDLEICCREREDFKGAYEYANHKLVILQQLLTE